MARPLRIAGTILENESVPMLSIDSLTVGEGSTAYFQVTLSKDGKAGITDIGAIGRV